MKNLTVRQRKMLYAAIAVVAFVPVLILGAPATNSRAESGGVLARTRTKYELGESSLGDVDPTSATMNLVLLGMRGVAASVLWQRADHYKTTKNFTQLQEAVESIILLQPHFKSVWEFQAWNLAYNVSAECDDVKDRYHWVKQGAKFLIRGTKRNEKVPELFFSTGSFFGTKIAVADESEVFREYFLEDPNTEVWGGKADEDINPEGKGHHLVARDWYLQANDILELPNVEQHRMDTALFIAYPYRSLINFAKDFQKGGMKDRLEEIESANLDLDEEQSRRNDAYQQWAEESQKNWENAHSDWKNVFGRMPFEVAGDGGTIILEPDDAVLQQLADEDNTTLEMKKSWQQRYRKLTSYPFWERHCEIEQRDAMTRARYHLVEGRRLFRNVQDFEGAKKYLEEGMRLLDSVINEYESEDGYNVMLIDESDTVEEGIKAILIWQAVLQLLGEEQPEDYPLKSVWDNPDFTLLKEDLTQRFNQWQGN